jgi:O-antigen/teichoic acid export membrane protein
VYRYLIAATAGLPAVAIFDMAMRVTQTARDAVATGFGVLYPSFAILVRKQQQDAIIEIIQVSLMILISVGSLSLGLVIALADPMLSLWLGSYPIDLKPAIVVLAAWQMLTLFNVPFWHLLMASGNERVAAYSVWTHTTSLLLIVPASSFFEIDTIDLLLYWSATAVLTQLLIFYFTEAVLGLFWAPLKSLRLRLAMILAVVFLVSCYLASQLITDSNLLVIFVALIAALYLLLAAFSTGRPIMEYLRREQSWKQ